MYINVGSTDLISEGNFIIFMLSLSYPMVPCEISLKRYWPYIEIKSIFQLARSSVHRRCPFISRKKTTVYSMISRIVNTKTHGVVNHVPRDNLSEAATGAVSGDYKKEERSCSKWCCLRSSGLTGPRLVVRWAQLYCPVLFCSARGPTRTFASR